MRIGPYTLANKLVLAPMAGITDRPFRSLCKRFGASLAVSEMVTANPGFRGHARTVLRTDHAGEAGVRVVQLLGADPGQMAAAARFNVGQGADIIDINMGCPAKKVCKVAAGSALLQDLALVGRILDAVVAAVPVPVTLKIRTGWDLARRNAVTVARLAEQAGVAALAVHGRSRACKFEGPCDYDTIRQVKESVSIPVIANGDIDSPAKAAQVLAHTGADALMIGRAALGNPWLFRQAAAFLADGTVLAGPEAPQVRAVLDEHLQALYQFYGDELGVRVARKHIAWYARHLPALPAPAWAAVNQAQTPKAQTASLEAAFDLLS